MFFRGLWLYMATFIIGVSGVALVMGKGILEDQSIPILHKIFLLGSVAVGTLFINRMTLHFIGGFGSIIEIWLDCDDKQINLNISPPNNASYIDFRVFLNIIREGTNKNLNIGQSYTIKSFDKLEFGYLTRNKNCAITFPMPADLVKQLIDSPESYFVATAVFTHEFTGIRATSSTMRLCGYHLEDLNEALPAVGKVTLPLIEAGSPEPMDQFTIFSKEKEPV
jgi:hypothetical protein